MCNACGYLCCGLDCFDGCGCESCGEAECAETCGDCGAPELDCYCGESVAADEWADR